MPPGGNFPSAFLFVGQWYRRRTGDIVNAADSIRLPAAASSSSFRWSGLALGFAFGGFFDGILLHQVLQWHHLLSGLDGAAGDIRLLILTDGLFHVLMYVVAGVGLWLLWQGRGQFATPASDRLLLGNVLIGFGAWHILDAVLSHWLLGIHRIRMDTDNPLFWDLLWLAVFGIVPLLAGLVLHRKGGTGGRRSTLRSHTALVIAIVLAGSLSALPPPSSDTTLVVFRPGTSPAQAMAGLAALNGRLMWSDSSGAVWAVEIPEGTDPGAFYRHGALLVSNSLLPAGCLDWTRA
ncbi:hypothetical protein REJC140_02546 [Pseudorhizobium endolithicum]|uniref:DUF2243 domain-containing protein n=1 Tax=Pseudorhizobium endolithicum TaxID=1191678 RepID=A0ABN7JGA0_9HYPH|nr:DUF2243 domain-containing protein [Pseudorhizobium endolithicum]CAD7027796.1 hypothetical protein REJC140_02546 [Pseudorhizobium endolithicum]